MTTDDIEGQFWIGVSVKFLKVFLLFYLTELYGGVSTLEILGTGAQTVPSTARSQRSIHWWNQFILPYTSHS